MPVSINGSNGLTFNDGSSQNTAATGFGFKNRIINGNMAIAQRATSSSTQGYTTVDRFYCNRAGSAAGLTMAQVYGAFSTNKYSLSLQRDAGNSSTAALYVYQPIEGLNCRDMAGQSVTASFQIGTGANVTTTGHAVQLFYQTSTTDIGATASWTQIASTAFTVTASTAFTQKTATFTVPSTATQLMLVISLNVTGTAGADDRFYITEVQLEKAPSATPFDARSFSDELTLCQRYYEKTYDLVNTPGAITTSGSITTFPAAFATYFPWTYKVSKRVVPTVVGYSTSSGASGNWSQNNSSDVAITGIISTGQNSACAYTGTSSNISAYIHFTASAEL